MSPNCKRLLADIADAHVYKHGFVVPPGYRLVGFRKPVIGELYLGVYSGTHILYAGPVSTSLRKLIVAPIEASGA